MRLPFLVWGVRLGLAALAHLLFWIALWLAHPYSSFVRRVFFSNPWWRRILGLGYVDILLGIPP